MRITSIFCVLMSSLLLVVACVPSEPVEYSPEHGEQSFSFSEYLADEYLRLAEYEQNTEGDYKAAGNYMDKVERIERGAIARIDNLENFDLSPSKVNELTQAQNNLVDALKNYRLAENRKTLAIAHSRYDCWLDQAEENNEKQNCKKEFKRVMRNLIVPLDNPENYLESEEEFFGWNFKRE